MNDISRKPARTVAELASARQHRQHQEPGKPWPAIMERAVEGKQEEDENAQQAAGGDVDGGPS